MTKSIKFLLLSLTLTLLVAVQAQAFGNQTGAAPSNQGTIVETMNAAGYTYVNLESNGQKIWAAVPQTQVKVGDQVAVVGGMPMQNFTSKTLGRTFPTILFAKGLTKQ